MIEAPGSTHLLEVSDLAVSFRTARAPTRAVDGVSFHLDPGETLGLVGESGCGKTVTALSLLGLAGNGRIAGGSSVRVRGQELVGAPEKRLRRVRGNEVAMIFQDPSASLDPVFTVGDQIVEALRLHRGMDGPAARTEAVRLLDEVGIADPDVTVDDYPHRLSGGMSQRVMIAMALSCEPALLIADEPTSALDSTVQAQILELLVRLQAGRGMAMLLISHDLTVVAEVCDRILVMQAGRVVETGTVEEVLTTPSDPYTRALIDAMPTAGRARGMVTDTGTVADVGTVAGLGTERTWTGPHDTSDPRLTATTLRPAVDRSGDPLLRARGLVKHFRAEPGPFGRRGQVVRAVAGVDLDIWPGETLALVGESGCGKSTTGRMLLRLIEATAGEVRFGGSDLRSMDRKALRAFRARAQMVFQDPIGSLNPRKTAGEALAEALLVHGLERRAVPQRVETLLERVGLGSDIASRYPHELSGGQRQRVGIARALSVQPEFLVLDEPVSALDASVRAQVITLLWELQRDLGLTYLFIAHDLPLVERVADRVAVMYLGRIVETGPVAEVFANPAHPYTRGLLSAVPSWTPGSVPRRRQALLQGETPKTVAAAGGCPFHSRCPHPSKDAECTTSIPPLEPVGPRRFAACIKAYNHP